MIMKKYTKYASQPKLFLEKLDLEFPATDYTVMTEEDSQIMKQWSKPYKSLMEKTNRQVDQIGMMQYVRESQFVIKHYRGRIRNGTVWDECKSYLRARWVKWVFKPAFWGMLMSNPGRWMPVPVGSTNPNLAPSGVCTTVECRYQQKDAEYCLVYSLASALHYVGLEKEALELAAIVEDTSDVSIDVAIQTLIVNMKVKVPQIGSHIMYGAFRKKAKAAPAPSIRDLCLEKTIYPSLVVPLGCDGSLNHAVCVVDDIVFDSTQAFALHLCLATFNWTVGEGGCKGIHAICRFEQPAKKGCGTLTREIKKNW